MELHVRDVSKLLNVSEKTVYRWVQARQIPVYRIGDQYRFNRSELLEWATRRKVDMSTDLFEEPEGSSVTGVSLADALDRGGIFYRVEGKDKTAALRSVVALMRVPDSVPREFILRVLLAREAMASTGIGNGVAIPHVRNQIVLHVPEPMVTLCFLEQPIDFGALDGKPVHCLFTLVSPTTRLHLFLLSRLAFGLRDPHLAKTIAAQGLRQDILAHFRRIEAGIAKRTQDGQP